MKNKVFPFVYVFFGFYCGYLVGAYIDREFSILVWRILYASAILVVGLFWRRIDQQSHQYHLEIWTNLRRRGKWYFVLTRYVLLRGLTLLLVFGAPLYFDSKFHGVAGRMLALIGGVLVLMMLLLGHIEWRYCVQDIEILAIKRVAEKAKLEAALHN
jgi:hypothetical protein